jgi:phage baseplate assembly protein W
MGRKLAKKRRAVLRLRDLDHSKSSILNSLTTALGIEEQTDPLGPNLHGIAPVSLASAESLVSIQ